jgi:hypothetical protein
MRALFIVAFAAFGCSHNIGDTCQTNVDCLFDGTRFCDTSSPDGQGYCTIEGCEFNTCPGEAVCIRFLTPVLDEPCTIPPPLAGANGKPQPQPLGQADCPHVDDRCVCDSASGGVCAPPTPVMSPPSPSPSPHVGNGHCAPETSERRWCQLHCSSNGDCRSGYECRPTGTLGAEPIPTLETPAGEPTSFCAPASPPK